MSTLCFTKFEGAGNDFILIDDRDLSFPWPNSHFIQFLCRRRFGVGADGVILLQTGKDPFCMRIFNSDGSEAESCGNGLRCFVLFLQSLGFSQDLYHISTKGGCVQARLIDDQVAVDMGQPQKTAFHLQTERGEVHFADTGVPHAVQFVSDVDAIDIKTAGSFFRHHPLFSPRGANVNFAALQKDRSFRVRTFERGLEAESVACGTGAAAVAAIARQLYGFTGPILIHFVGGTLIMEGNWMIGPARKIFSAVFG